MSFSSLASRFTPSILPFRLLLLSFPTGIETTFFFVFLSALILVVATLSLIYGSTQPSVQLAVFYSPLFIQTMASATVFAVFLVVYALCASSVNTAYKQHKVTLAMHCLDASNKAAQLEEVLDDIATHDPPTAEEDRVLHVARAKLVVFRAISRTLTSSVETLAVNGDVAPIEVFGIRADGTLTAALFSGLVSFCITVGGTYLNIRTQVDRLAKKVS